jgi:hypothetical protein
MARLRAKPHESFTIEQANAMLPLVRAIVTDLVTLSQEVIERRRRLSYLLSGRNSNDHDLYHQELLQVEKDLERDSQQLREYVEELRALGVEPLHGPEGIVTFPSVLDGRKVCLSWKLGDSEVLYWHEEGSGFRRRRPIVAESSTAG